MPREFSRTQRIADQIQRDLAGILQLEMRDPRLGMVTINEVKVSQDLSYSDIYVTFLGIDESKESFKTATKVLNQASGYLRTRLGKALRLRFVPALRFHYDESLLRGQHLTTLIERAVSDDKDKPETSKATISSAADSEDNNDKA